MLKHTIFISILLTIVFHAAFAADEKEVFVTSIYESLYNSIEVDSAGEIKQFISFGADINYRYDGAKTPLMLAARLGKLNAVNVLLELGARTDLVSAENKSAIDYAQENGNDSIITTLSVNTSVTNNDSDATIIRKIQFLLGRLGYNTGEVDGNYGERTKISLEKFTNDTKQKYPAELSKRQVESLKHAFFKNDFKDEVRLTDKKDNEGENINSEEEIAIIKAVPLETSTDNSSSPSENPVDAFISSKKSDQTLR